MEHGFIKVAAAVPVVRVADPEYNVQQIENLIVQAEGKGVEIIVFPELCLTGYTCQDLFAQNVLLDAAEAAVMTLLDFTRQLNIVSIVGLPVVVGDLLLNCAAVIQKGDLLADGPSTEGISSAMETQFAGVDRLDTGSAGASRSLISGEAWFEGSGLHHHRRPRYPALPHLRQCAVRH